MRKQEQGWKQVERECGDKVKKGTGLLYIIRIKLNLSIVKINKYKDNIRERIIESPFPTIVGLYFFYKGLQNLFPILNRTGVTKKYDQELSSI